MTNCEQNLIRPILSSRPSLKPSNTKLSFEANRTPRKRPGFARFWRTISRMFIFALAPRNEILRKSVRSMRRWSNRLLDLVTGWQAQFRHPVKKLCNTRMLSNWQMLLTSFRTRSVKLSYFATFTEIP